jgi:broad specificity phosphatase PhoE
MAPLTLRNNHFFVLRHGKSVPNAQDRICADRPAGARPENGLNEEGRGQAREAG